MDAMNITKRTFGFGEKQVPPPWSPWPPDPWPPWPPGPLSRGVPPAPWPLTLWPLQPQLPPFYGYIPGVSVGDKWRGRPKASCIGGGVHRPFMNGICYGTWAKSNRPSMSICMSGGYEDDEEGEGDSATDKFWYTGDGGNDLLASSSQTMDQKYVRGNEALGMAHQQNLPVSLERFSAV